MSEPIVRVQEMGIGLFHMRVCTPIDATDEQVLAHCNRISPRKWSKVHRDGVGFWGPERCTDLNAHYIVSREQE